MKPKVKFTNVSKKYNLFRKKSDILMDIFSLNKKQKSFYALKNISFEVYEGETIGVIGVNGSGKSTLSNLLAGIIPPTTGSVEINGETSLVAISAGLNNSLSGLENIRLKCLMHGLNKKEIEEVVPEIIEFADIGEFIYQPIKTYSSGMKSRLGFAISVHVNPDILVVDEALSVGDQTFYEKCIGKFNDFKKQGKTIFFISHSLSQIRSISDRVLWMNFGEIKEFDNNEVVLANYQKFIQWFNSLSDAEKKEHRSQMLKEQMQRKSSTIEQTTINRGGLGRTINKRVSKKRSIFLGTQIAILSGLFLISGSLLFVEKPMSFFQDRVSLVKSDTGSQKKEAELVVSPEKIEKKGLIIGQHVSIFKDQDLTNKIIDVPFATKVFIEEQYGDNYKVHFEDNQGFINSRDVIIDKKAFEKSSITINSLLPLFPVSFANSFQYSLAHMGMNVDEIKLKFNGLSEETEDQFGNKLLVYNGENMTFQFDDNGIANTIIVSEINVNDPVFNDILSAANFQTADQDLLYLLTEQNKFILDKHKKTIKITSLKN